MLGAEWLHTLVPIIVEFHELYMSFVKDSHTYLVQGINTNPPAIINYHHMEKLLNKGHSCIISQLHALQLCETPTLDPPLEMKKNLDTYNSVFDLPTGLPLACGEHDHSIPLILGIQLPNVCPYRYPFSQKNEIEKHIQELLATGVISPSTSPNFFTNGHGFKERRWLADVS